MLSELSLLSFVEFGEFADDDAAAGESGMEAFFPDLRGALSEDADFFGDEVELIVGGEPIGGESGDFLFALFDESGDANHVELIEIGFEDGEEFAPFEERVFVIFRFMEDAGIELEPAEFSVDVAFVAVVFLLRLHEVSHPFSLPFANSSIAPSRTPYLLTTSSCWANISRNSK